MASSQSSLLSSLNLISSSKYSLFTSINTIKAYPSKSLKFSSSPNPPNPEFPQSNSPETLSPVDPVKLAFERAKAYKKLAEKNPDGDSEGKNSGIGKLDLSGFDGVAEQKKMVDGVEITMENENESKKNTGVAFGGKNGGEINSQLGLKNIEGQSFENNGQVENVDKKGELSISSIDFIGLGFADKKKTRGLPAGLVPVVDSFSTGDLPEVEIIVGDTSNFDDTKASNTKPQEDDANLYKPKVSTWGVFPRPGNISKTFGGGRTIRPGDVLETDEEKAAKEAHTKELIAAYKKKVGLSIDAKLKSECEEALEEGDLLMNAGKLREALPYYEKIMDKLNFQSELHGLAALQWSICQDSLSRLNEAREMYEKLRSHPIPRVSKKARQFMYTFQAMEMMKVTTKSPLLSKNTDFQNYFEAFIENRLDYTATETGIGEGVLNQSLPYIIFLLSPILLVILAAIQKKM